MNAEYAVDLLKSLMMQAAALAAPVLLLTMAIGLSVSLFQAVTSIHEQTLAFVPKVVGVVALLAISLPWMMRTLLDFTRAMIERMPQMVQ